MSTGSDTTPNRARFLVIHDDSVALDQRGPFREHCKALTNCGADVHVIRAGSAVDAMELATDAMTCGGYDALAIAGGVAVLEGVQAGVMQGALPVGVLPVGDCTLLGQTLGLTGKPSRVASLLCSAPLLPVSGLLANGEPAQVMAGFGLDRDLFARFSRSLCPAMPHKVSAVSLAPSLLRQVQRFDVSVDGMSYRCNAMFVVPTQGLIETPIASLDQQSELTAILVEADDRAAMFDLLVSIKLGRMFKDKSVNVRACNQLEIPGGQPLVAQLDGRDVDFSGARSTPINLTVNSVAMTMIAAPDVCDRVNSSTMEQTSAAA